MKKILAAGIGIGLIVLAGLAGAGVVTSLPGGTVVPMPGIYYFGPGPQVFDGIQGTSIQWTSTNSATYGGSLFGYVGIYGFESNGYWSSLLGPMAGLNSALGVASVIDTMTFEFSVPVSGVGGFMNYDPSHGNPVIAVYDSGHNLIESHTLNFSTSSYPPNQGFFYGFLESSAVIKYFTLSNSFIGIANLTVTTTAPVPKYSCLGFENPMGQGPVTGKNNRVLPLKVQLIDQYGALIIDTDVASPPVLQVTGKDSGGSNADLTNQGLVAGQGTEKKQFVFSYDGKWQFNLMTKNYTTPGTYTISILTGDSSEYAIEPSCTATFMIE